MPAYLSSRVGRNLRVGVRLGKRRKSTGQSTAILALFATGIAFYCAVVFWPYLLALFVGMVVVGTGINRAKIRSQKRAKTIGWGNQVEEILALLGNRHELTPVRQRRECDQAIKLLRHIKRADPGESIIKNPFGLIETLESMKKTTPLLVPLKRANLAEFKGNSKQLLDACLDLLFCCKTEQITNRELLQSNLCFDRSETPLSIELLHEKCVALGWNGEDRHPSGSLCVHAVDGLPPPLRNANGSQRIATDRNGSQRIATDRNGSQRNGLQSDGAVQCPCCRKMVKTERGMVKHLMGTARCGGHGLSEQEARKQARKVFRS